MNILNIFISLLGLQGLNKCKHVTVNNLYLKYYVATGKLYSGTFIYELYAAINPSTVPGLININNVYNCKDLVTLKVLVICRKLVIVFHENSQPRK